MEGALGIGTGTGTAPLIETMVPNLCFYRYKAFEGPALLPPFHPYIYDIYLQGTSGTWQVGRTISVWC